MNGIEPKTNTITASSERNIHHSCVYAAMTSSGTWMSDIQSWSGLNGMVSMSLPTTSCASDASA